MAYRVSSFGNFQSAFQHFVAAATLFYPYMISLWLFTKAVCKQSQSEWAMPFPVFGRVHSRLGSSLQLLVSSFDCKVRFSRLGTSIDDPLRPECRVRVLEQLHMVVFRSLFLVACVPWFSLVVPSGSIPLIP